MRHALSALLLCLPAAAGDIRLATDFHPLTPVPVGVIGMDLNDDGLDDVVVFSANPVAAHLYFTNPDGGSNPGPTVTLSGATLGMVRKADLTGDGREDLVIHVPGAGYYLLANTGQGTLTGTGPGLLQSPNNPQVFALADTDDDGILDLISVFPGGFQIHKGRPGGHFDPPGATIQIPPGFNRDVVVTDLNGNGSPEICVLQSLAVQFYERNGPGFEPAATVTLNTHSYRMTAGGTGSQGTPSLIIPASNSVGAMVCYHDQTDGYTLVPAQITGTLTTASTTFGDFNGDGLTDVVITGTLRAPIRILTSSQDEPHSVRERGDPIGHFNELRYAAALDANGDGRDDLVCVSTSPRGFFILTQHESGGLEHNGHHQPLGVPPTSLARSPLGDTTPSYIVGHTTNQQPIPLISLVPAGVGHRFEQSSLTGVFGGNQQAGWTPADINGDGISDIVWTTSLDAIPRFRWQVGHADGFSPALNRPIPGATAVQSPIIADLNADGFDDVAALTNAGAVAIVFGNPSGFFSEPHIVPLASASSPGSLAVVDLDLDGHLDLICAHRASTSLSEIRIAYGRGDGTFEAPVSLPTIPAAGSPKPGFIAFADINGDRYPDIVVARTNSSVVHLSAGPRQHGPDIPIASGGNVQGVRIVDLNGDLRPEILTIFESNTAIHRYTLQGTLEPVGSFLHARFVNDALFEDVDGNGLPDMIYLSPEGVNIVYNQSDTACAADYNRDGAVDLFDIARFMQDFNAGSAFADLNADGVTDFFDIAIFLRAFAEGCP